MLLHTEDCVVWQVSPSVSTAFGSLHNGCFEDKASKSSSRYAASNDASIANSSLTASQTSFAEYLEDYLSKHSRRALPLASKFPKFVSQILARTKPPSLQTVLNFDKK